jgi:hypothetical protein
MSSQDELLARRLYEDELAAERVRQEAQAKADEEMARRLAEDYQAEAAGFRPPPAQRQGMMLHAGQQATIRLHHPETKNFIGEVFNVSYLDATTMTFELRTRPGFRMRVTDHGKVEFSELLNRATQFTVELVGPSGPMYIICKEHSGKINVLGETGWYLCLERDGQLIGNGARTPLAHWLFVAADQGMRMSICK